MTTYQASRRTWPGVAVAAVMSLLSACGGSDEATPAAEPASEATTAESAAKSASDVGDTIAAPEAESAPAAAPPGSRSATLSLDNGELFEFSVLCSLEPQIAAGSEILFTASSFDDPSLDVTQFGDEGPVVNLANISVYDASFETLWEANSIFEAFGGSIELSLDGSTINGSGAFYPGGDIALTPVNGTLIANC